MDRAILPAVSILTGIIGLFIGIILGALLGSVGSFQLLAFITRLPIVLIRSPKKLKSKWRMWQELRDLRKTERLKKKKKMKDLKANIGEHKKEITKIKAQIRRAKWGFTEPD